MGMSETSKVTQQEVIKVLKAAKRRIQTKGWCQGANEVNGRLCLINSVSAVERTYQEGSAARLTLEAVLPPVQDKLYSNAAFWNDASERTKADVLKAFDAAITLAGI